VAIFIAIVFGGGFWGAFFGGKINKHINGKFRVIILWLMLSAIVLDFIFGVIIACINAR